KGSGPKGRIIEADIQEFLKSRPKMTPLAKRISAEKGALPQNSGTGLAGTSRASDLAFSHTTVLGQDFVDRKISNIRKIIARSMHTSLQNSAQLTHHLSADARFLLQLRKDVKSAYDQNHISANITLNDMVCFAVIK